MNESYSPKFCKVHKVSNGVALHHIVAYFRITYKGSTPTSMPVHSKDIRSSKIFLPQKQWAVVTAYGERKAQQDFFCKTKSSSLWSPVGTLILVSTCCPAVVNQMSGVKWGCALWQKVDLLLTKVMYSPEKSHKCTITMMFTLACYLAAPVTANKLMFLEK